LRFGDAYNFADSLLIDFTVSANPVGVAEGEANITEFQLSQNYPNPFSAKSGRGTEISYVIPSLNSGKSGNVNLSVFDILGRKVATLVNHAEAKGKHSVKFRAGKLPSGIYFYTLSYGGITSTKKMILMK